MFYFHRTPKLLEWLYPGMVWHMDRSKKEVYLTFDDGPVPSITPDILDILKEKGVNATFFCVGDNIRKHAAILERICEEGHAVGNHTYHHINGWSSSTSVYCNDVSDCDAILKNTGIETTLFRPPYGKISRAQASILRDTNKKIIMWDVLTGDFDTRLSWETCFKKSIPHIRPGSVIVLHDNPKARARTMELLPPLIDHIRQLDLKCSAIPF
ncbi:MAG: polysaccharide deacetylase family protein [Cyclobacteriaceae bacterium]